jgi:hypothetical protein
MKGKFFFTVFASTILALWTSFNASSATTSESSFLLKEELTPGAIQMLPVTIDFRNYFILQSIGNSTAILVGDFSGAEKNVFLVTDEKQDGTVDKVYEFLPDAKKVKTPSKPGSSLFSSFAQMKDEIINGSIYNANYSYKMLSLDTLTARIKAGKDIYDWRYGHNIKVYDPDNPSTIMGEYFFSRKDGSYTLIFATYYYKLYKTKIIPPLYYSVFCKDSKDPKIKEVVDSLYKLLPSK